MKDILWLDGILNRSEVNFKIMAFKGTAGKSSTGASMSKYDVEVEGRLKALETAVAALQSHSHDAPAVGGDVAADLAKLEGKLIARFGTLPDA